MHIAISPWYSIAEWTRVRDQILSSDPAAWSDAKFRIYCWKARVERLPAGVETTLCLLETKLSPHSHETDPSIRLTLSAAVNRFLNHISHIGKRRYNTYTFEDAVVKFGIPDWLVDLRHETTHGTMMTLDYLRSGLDFCWNWIRINYWASSASEAPESDHEETEMDYDSNVEEKDESSEIDSRLSPALEVYFYLNIYKQWKTKKVGDIRDQPKLFDHLEGLWAKATENKFSKKRIKMDSFGNLAIKKAMHSMKLTVFDVGSKNWMGFFGILLSEHLLFPQMDILTSLVGETHDRRKPYVIYQKLPPSLVGLWSDLIEFISEHEKIPDLLLCLVKLLEEGSGGVPKYDQSMACGWILELCRGILSPPSDSIIKLPHPEGFNEFVSYCILHPNEYSKYYIDSVFQLRTPRWAPKKEKDVCCMIKAFENDSQELEANYVPRSTMTQFEDAKWSPAADINWSEYPLGYVFGSELECNVPLEARNKLAESVESFPPSRVFKMGKMIWENDTVELVKIGCNGSLPIGDLS